MFSVLDTFSERFVIFTVFYARFTRTSSNLFVFHQDEDVYSFFEPELPNESMGSIPRNKTGESQKLPGERKSSSSSSKPPAVRNGSKSPHGKPQRSLSVPEKKSPNPKYGNQKQSPEVSWNVLDLKKENYFSCAVGRKRTNARFILGSSDEVVSFLKQLSGSGPET